MKSVVCALAASVTAMTMAMSVHAADDSAYLNSLYQYLHAHPELSFHETATAKRVADELRLAGYEVSTGFGGNGVVAIMKNGNGPMLMLRTDMDALPIIEQTGLAYASKITTKDDDGNTVGVMHACGHDIHMTVLIGAARELARRKNDWHGTLMLIGQPAEERSGGAKAMLAAGLYEKFGTPNYNVALHSTGLAPAGALMYSIGPAFAAVDSLDVTVHGVGGHGANPHLAKDPIVLSAQIINDWQTIVSREITPGQAAVITVGSIHGGTKHNIIPADVKMQLTVRSYRPEVRAKLLAAIERIAKGAAIAAGIPDNLMPTIVRLDESLPATINDPVLMQRLANVFRQQFGAGNVRETEPVTGAEDFSFFGQTAAHIPSVIYWLGISDPEKFEKAKQTGESMPNIHSSMYAPLPEPSISTGVKAMVAVTTDLMGSTSSQK